MKKAYLLQYSLETAKLVHRQTKATFWESTSNVSSVAPQFLQFWYIKQSNVIRSFEVIAIIPELIGTAISKLNVSYAASLDGIPSCLLKKISTEHIETLEKNIYIKVLLNMVCYLCDENLHVSSSQVHEKGDIRNIENYRGITSLCACSKILELIVNDALTACNMYRLLRCPQLWKLVRKSTSQSCVRPCRPRYSALSLVCLEQ